MHSKHFDFSVSARRSEGAESATSPLAARHSPLTGISVARPSILYPLALASLFCLVGCATTGEDCTPQVGSPDLTPARVSATGERTGRLQRWGGTLISTRNLPDSTELEVMAYPLNRCGQPRVGQEPTGRFLARSSGFLEPMDYQAGRQVTVTGMISEVRNGEVGEAPYRFPVLEGAKVKLWPGAQETADGYAFPVPRPWINIGIGGGSGGWGGWGGGIGVSF